MTTPCSDLSRARDEPMTATASRVERWLLVEHPGPWGPPSLPLSRLPAPLAERLAAVTPSTGARVLMIRRPVVAVDPPAGRTVYVVDSRPGHEAAWVRCLDDDALAIVDLPLTEPPGAGWEPVERPLLLVCTHGKHDVCCAVRGRPVARALADRRPDDVWECSHMGGDRFAPNVVVLPLGLYLGRVAAEDADALLAGLDDGRVPPAWVRGRSSLPLPVQAAQHFARARTGRDRLDDLALADQRGAGPDAWRVRLSGTAGPDVDVEVRYLRDAQPPALLTCGAAEEKVAPAFECVDLVELA